VTGGEIFGIGPGDDGARSEDEPVGAGESPLLKVDPDAVALALGWLLDLASGEFPDGPVPA
jgi:hypothetical protein